jgi:hypothetical protein
MTQQTGRTRVPAPIAARLTVRTVSLALLLIILAVVLTGLFRSPMKDDIAWLLYVARRWMAGRELYIDLIEVNPPLIVWISAIPIVIADWLGVAARWVAMPVFIAMVLGCAWWAASLLRDRASSGIKLFADPVPVFAVIGAVLLVLPGVDLAQREHLLVAAFLPYLVLFARTLDGRPTRWPVAVCAGVLAGLGGALKPQYAAAFAALEVLALTQGLPPWRVMPIAAALTLAAYAVSIGVFCPAYLHRAVPMALALYGATSVTLARLLTVSATLLLGEAAVLAVLVVRGRALPDRNLLLTLLTFGVASNRHLARHPALGRLRSDKPTPEAPSAAPRRNRRRLPGLLRVHPARRTADRRRGGGSKDHRRPSGTHHPRRARPHLCRLLRVAGPRLSRRQQHRRRLGIPLRFHVGPER